MNFASHLNTLPIFSEVAATAQQLGFPAYIVGGYVRDLILKRPFKKDIDFVCVGSGVAWAEEVAKRTGATDVAIFKNFGTAMVRVNGLELEFVGARKESYRSDSRKPSVEDGTLEDDQNRRDFTINAMAISLNKANYGELIDPFEGVKDLERKIIRTPLPPGITFSDDPLRMMRAIRFATQLGFDIDPDTFTAIQDHKDRISIVSQERTTDELNKIILATTPSYGFKLLYHAGLLELIFPDFVKLKGVETMNGVTHKDNFYHTLQVLDNLCEYSDDLWLRWAALLHDIAKPATKRFHPKAGWTFHGHEDKGARMVPDIFKQLKLPLNEKMKYVQQLVRLHLRPIALSKETITESALRRLLFEAGDTLEGVMMLCRADITSKNNDKVKKYLHNFDIVEQKLLEVESKDRVRNFQPVITGEIIMEVFGLKPSKEVGDIKHELREAMFDGKIRNVYEESYSYMLAVGARMGLKPVKVVPQPLDPVL